MTFKFSRLETKKRRVLIWDQIYFAALVIFDFKAFKGQKKGRVEALAN